MKDKSDSDHLHDFSDDYYAKKRKDDKHDKKIASKTDRSKYKKTDYQKFQEDLQEELLSKSISPQSKKGIVVSVKSEGIVVKNDEGLWLCGLRGLLKKTITHEKNLIAVGDRVFFEPLSDREGTITYIENRTSILSRSDSLQKKKQQVLAANIDQVLITTSVVSPALKPPLVDRYLIACMKGGLKAVIVVNKIDLLTEEDPELAEFIKTHEKMGTPVVLASSVSEHGLDELIATMKDKVSVFSGQSGVGKSSLINAMTGENFAVREVVEKTQKGAHTTTSSLLIPLPFGGWVVDTPGIKSFGIWDLSKEELRFYFPEFDEFSHGCKFTGCTHTHEPDCQVKEALEKGLISPQRYLSYLVLEEEIDKEEKRR